MFHTPHAPRTCLTLTACALAIMLAGIASAGPALQKQAQSNAPTQTPTKASTSAPTDAPTKAPAPTLDSILKDLSTWDGGIESAAVWKLRDYVNARRNDSAGRTECEAGLLRFLTSGATHPAKVVASRHLRVIATDTAVPALQAMLANDALSDLALFPLQQIPGEAAEKALVRSVTTTKGTTQIAVIAALGQRRSTAAVPAIAALLKEPATANAAAVALGRIGNAAAATALQTASAVASGPAAPARLKSTIASSLLSCAETAVAAKNSASALAIYEPLVTDTSLPAPIRRAAALGALLASRSQALLMQYLAGSSAIKPDEVLQEAAIARIRDVIAPENISPLCDMLPKLPEGSQLQLLAVLSAYPADRVRPAVLESARSATPAIRLAALKALESIGNETDVPFLIQLAAGSKGQEQTTARATLAALKGPAIGGAILTALAGAKTDDVKGELLLAAADRRIFTAKPLIIASLASPSASLRLQALRSLRSIGTPSDESQVMDLLLATSDERERAEAGRTIVALAQKVSDANARSRFVRSRLGGEKAVESRIRLIALLPMIGDVTALPVLRTALADPDADVYDAAVRAFAAWPSSAAKDDVIRLARDSRNETHRLLAIAGLVRIIGLDSYRDPDAAVADLKMAAGFAWRPEEQKLVLSALSKFACQDALDLANGFLREPAVSAEAKAAITRIKARMPKDKDSK